MVESVYPQVPSAIEAEVATVDDGAGDSLPVWLHEGHVVDWLLELALVGLVILAWKIADGGVVHEFDLVVEVPWAKGVDLVEERSPCFHSCLLLLAHPGVDLIEASDMVFGLLRQCVVSFVILCRTLLRWSRLWTTHLQRWSA